LLSKTLPSAQAQGLRLAPALHEREEQRVREMARTELTATFRAVFLTEPSGRLLARLDTIGHELFRGFVMAAPEGPEDFYNRDSQRDSGRDLAHAAVLRLFDLATLDAAWPA
jgi:hypothetical protein